MIKLQESVSFNGAQVRDLRQLVLQGEGLHLEFKRKAAYPDKLVREMIAFANTEGGTLLVGVDDDKSIPGLKHPEEESYVIQMALRKCKPSLTVDELYIPIGNARTVLQYKIKESKRKPHFLISSPDKKESFVRVNDQSIKASREVREIYKRRSRRRGVKFHYGDFERTIFQYLGDHPGITLKKFMEISGLKRFVASNKLILLVLANVLKISPDEKGDVFSMVLPGEK